MRKSKKSKKVNGVHDDNRGRQFVDVVVIYVNAAKGSAEVHDDGTVQFPARVGEREMDVHCWFVTETSQARITLYFYDVCPPTLIHEVANFIKPILALSTNVSGSLRFSDTGHVKWMSGCQVKPSDVIDTALVNELVGVGVRESNRLVDQISAFVAGFEAGRTSVGSTDAVGGARRLMNGQPFKDESLN